MKRILTLVIAAIIMVNFTGCKGQSSNEAAEKNRESFDINIATNILNAYMGYLKNEDIERGKELYSKELIEKGVEPYPTNLKIIGYKIDEVNEVGRSGIFKVKIVRGAPDKVISILDNYHIKIELVDNEYRITEISTEPEKEVFLEGEGIRLKDQNSVSSNLVVDMAGIPFYAYPKNDAAMINKAPVPKKSFGMIILGYDGEKIAITTKDENNTYIAIVKIDETGTAQSSNGGSTGGSGSSESGGGGGGKAGGSNTIIKESPMGKEIASLDILQKATIENLAFSLEEKVIMAQFKIDGKNTTMRVYDVESGDIVDFKFEEKFPPDKVDVIFSSFDKEVLNFEVREKEGSDKDASELSGKWQLDLKKFQVRKL